MQNGVPFGNLAGDYEGMAAINQRFYAAWADNRVTGDSVVYSSNFTAP